MTFDSPYGALATTSRTGYTFAGWFTAPIGGSLVTAATIMTTASNHTLWAQWTANQYIATFNAQSGTTPSPSSKQVTFDSSYGALPTTSRTGYNFTGWFTAPTGGTSVTPSTIVTATSNHTLYAQWSEDECLVTFDPQGGTTPNPETKLVAFDSPYGALATTSRTGYTFVGWFTAPGGGSLVTPETVVNILENHTLYAQWTANEYTVTFDPQGGATPVPESKQVIYDSAYGELAATSRTGYIFKGWFTAPTGGTQVTAAGIVETDSNHTLYAQWTANQYTVTFASQGGTETEPESKQVTYDSTYDELPETTRTGYNFTGWFTAPTGGTSVTPSTIVTTASNHTLYAQWSEDECLVTFDSQGGTTPHPETKLVTFDSPYGALATTARTGYTFKGWFTAPTGGTQVTPETVVNNSQNQTLYAQWTANEYTVTFDPQGGATPSPSSKQVTFNSSYGALATTSRMGYTFAGWFTAPGSGSLVTAATIMNTASNHTLYAQWMANEYTVTFDPQGGTTPNPETKLVALGSPYGTLATTSWMGYTFAGWFTAPTGDGLQISADTIVTTASNHTLYARWTFQAPLTGARDCWMHYE